VEESVRKIVENAFANTLTHRMTNSTIDLVANATFLRYMQDVEFGFDMPGVVTRLQVFKIPHISPIGIFNNS
jgi:hypothetical protein